MYFGFSEPAGTDAGSFNMLSVEHRFFFYDQITFALVQTVIVFFVQAEHFGIGRNNRRIQKLTGSRKGIGNMRTVIFGKGGGCRGIDQTDVQNPLSEYNRIDAVGFGCAGKFNINAVFALLADNRFGKTEFIDAAAQGFNRLIHRLLSEFGFVIYRNGTFLRGDCGVQIGLYDNAHTAGQVQTELYRAVVAVFSFQYLLTVARFKNRTHFAFGLCRVIAFIGKYQKRVAHGHRRRRLCAAFFIQLFCLLFKPRVFGPQHGAAVRTLYVFQSVYFLCRHNTRIILYFFQRT